MILSVDNHPDGVQHRAIYRSSSSSDKQAATLRKAEMKQARQMGARVPNLKRRIATMERLVVECDRIAADLDREIRIEEDRTKIQNPAHTAYSFYAKATASRRDNLIPPPERLESSFWKVRGGNARADRFHLPRGVIRCAI